MTNRNDRSANTTSRLLRGALLVAIGAILGAAVSRFAPDAAPDLSHALFAAEGLAGVGAAQAGAEPEYEYLTFRRNIWVVHRPSSRIQFFMFPEDEEQQLVRSRVLQIDVAAFPPELTHFQLSERNLTNFLWVLNPTTGQAQYVRAGRDGVLEASAIENLTRQE
jgi:hypothetical protein